MKLSTTPRTRRPPSRRLGRALRHDLGGREPGRTNHRRQQGLLLRPPRSRSRAAPGRRGQGTARDLLHAGPGRQAHQPADAHGQALLPVRRARFGGGPDQRIRRGRRTVPVRSVCKLISDEPLVDNPWRFAGGYFDKQTGLYKFGTRYYDPGLLRWTQTDPVKGQLSSPMC